MSRRSPASPTVRSHALFGALLLTVPFLFGCWEQWSEAWFPQMKWQKAVQAFERVQHDDQIAPFLPPEGSMPIDGEAPWVGQYDPAADSFVNPVEPNFKSLARGQELYEQNCTVCHGASGMGDGPISAAGEKTGPFAGVFPLVTAIARSDGYIYNLLRNGGNRMPNYRRIPTEDRWHIVNYTRYLQKGGQP